MHYYPLKFSLEGMSQPYLWGGRQLAQLVPGVAEDEPVAEVWAVSDRPEEGKISYVENGPLAGRTLQSLLAEDPIGFLGFDTPGHRFPILVKLMDSKQRLSVQVHPPVDVAEKLGGHPKAEAWLGLGGSAETAYIYGGLKAGVTKSRFKAALNDGSVERFLHYIPIQPGTVFNVPNGRVHGIGEGCILLEVQQSSDTTYRVFDYNRVDARTGTTRPLHVEQALASINFSDHEPKPTLPQTIHDARGERLRLLATDHFTWERYTGQGATSESTKGVATILVNVKPSTRFLVNANDTAIEQSSFEFSLIPAATDMFMVTGSELDYVLIRPVSTPSPQSNASKGEALPNL